MNKQEWLVGIIGLLAGVVLTVVIAGSYYSNNHQGTGMSDMMRLMGGDRQVGMNMGMDDMMAELNGKSGDDFDKAFISTMIMHHQGAIEMANEAKTSAKHDEIKKLADDIVTAQTKEINEMKAWYKSWFNTDVPEYRMMNGMMNSSSSNNSTESLSHHNQTTCDETSCKVN